MSSDLGPSVLKFFIDGYKPAVAFLNASQQEGISYLRKVPYPYTKIIHANTIFFQTHEKMKTFENAVLEGRKKNKHFDHYILLGEALGLPESAVKMARTPGRILNFVINFFGFAFSTTEELVTENLKWLKETYRVPHNYPGTIEVIDKRETVYTLKLSHINSFKPVVHNGLFVNKITPIFSVITVLQVISAQLYNGHDIRKALKVISNNKDKEPQIDVWVADKLLKTYYAADFEEFKAKYLPIKV
jgi:hypothetical protein